MVIAEDTATISDSVIQDRPALCLIWSYIESTCMNVLRVKDRVVVVHCELGM